MADMGQEDSEAILRLDRGAHIDSLQGGGALLVLDLLHWYSYWPARTCALYACSPFIVVARSSTIKIQYRSLLPVPFLEQPYYQSNGHLGTPGNAALGLTLEHCKLFLLVI